MRLEYERERREGLEAELDQLRKQLQHTTTELHHCQMLLRQQKVMTQLSNYWIIEYLLNDIIGNHTHTRPWQSQGSKVKTQVPFKKADTRVQRWSFRQNRPHLALYKT